MSTDDDAEYGDYELEELDESGYVWEPITDDEREALDFRRQRDAL